MANVDLVPQELSHSSATTPSYTAVNAVDTYRFPNNGKTIIHFKKTGAGDATITVVTPAELRGQAVADPTHTVVATTGDKMLGTFPVDLYNDASGRVSFTSNEGTALTVAVVRV